jgi:hypothetical protein
MKRMQTLGLPYVRSYRFLMLLLLVVAAALSVAWTAKLQEENRSVVSEVVNGTPDGTIPDNMSVTVHTFSGMEETGVYTTTVSAEGSFRLEDVSLEDGETVVARTVHEGVTYVSEFVTVEPEQRTLSLPVTIYETTEDRGGVAVSQLHVFVNRVEGAIQVGAYAVIGNTGDRTYVGLPEGGVRTTWSIQLPDGAENLQFDSAELGGRFVPLADGFADTRPVAPGAASVETSFTYQIPFREGVEIRHLLNLPVRAAVLVLPEGEWMLEGASLSSEGTLETQMGPALSYTAGPLAAGEPLAFTIVAGGGTERSTVPSAGVSNGLAFGIISLVLAGVGVTLLWRSPTPGSIPEEIRAEIAAIASLDRHFESGRLPEKTYREQRQSLKEQIRRTLSS